MSKLEELKAAYEAAGSGHWAVDNNTNALAYPGWELIDLSVIPPCVFAVAGTEARFKFIALAHNNMAALLEAVVELGRFVEYLGVAGCDGAYDREIERAVNLLENLK